MLCFLSLQITKNVLKTSSKMPLQVELKQVSTDRIGFSVRSFTSLRTADILLGFFLLYSFNGTGMASVTVSMDDAGLLCISILHLHYFFWYRRPTRGNVGTRHNTSLDLYMPSNNDNYHMSTLFVDAV